MATAHASYYPERDEQYGQLDNGVRWYCYLCGRRSPTLGAAERHFVAAHPQAWRLWAATVLRRIRASGLLTE